MVSSAAAKHIRERYAANMVEWMRALDVRGMTAGVLRLRVIEYLLDEKHL